jgi:hypothetical protein
MSGEKKLGSSAYNVSAPRRPFASFNGTAALERMPCACARPPRVHARIGFDVGANGALRLLDRLARRTVRLGALRIHGNHQPVRVSRRRADDRVETEKLRLFVNPADARETHAGMIDERLAEHLAEFRLILRGERRLVRAREGRVESIRTCQRERRFALGARTLLLRRAQSSDHDVGQPVKHQTRNENEEQAFPGVDQHRARRFLLQQTNDDIRGHDPSSGQNEIRQCKVERSSLCRSHQFSPNAAPSEATRLSTKVRVTQTVSGPYRAESRISRSDRKDAPGRMVDATGLEPVILVRIKSALSSSSPQRRLTTKLTTKTIITSFMAL